MAQNVIEIRGLSRQFGRSLALSEVNLTLPAGVVYGLVGGNGAGKTTLIRHLLGLLRAQSGTVRVFGLDPVQQPVAVLSRIGYLSEDRDLPEWMRIDELLAYTAAFYPSWDADYARRLVNTFDLDPAKKIKQLSKGMRAQVGLIAAVAHHPPLLLLDEPSTGLDAVVRKDILNAIVHTAAEGGHTVLFSSHLLDEVELMSDDILMMDHGRLVLQGTADNLRQQHRVLEVVFEIPREELPAAEHVLSATGCGRQWTLVCDDQYRSVQETLVQAGGQVVNSRVASLQEIFIARAGRRSPPRPAAVQCV